MNKSASLTLALTLCALLLSGCGRTLEKAGFHYEGLKKNNAVKNGKLLDMKLYALTRDEEAWHRQGVGCLLFDAMRRDYASQVFTVNSSPYAVEVYRHLGFVPTDTEQLTNGIRYTPMRFEEKEQSQR